MSLSETDDLKGKDEEEKVYLNLHLQMSFKYLLPGQKLLCFCIFDYLFIRAFCWYLNGSNLLQKFETNVTDDVSNANEANAAKPEDLEVKDGEEKVHLQIWEDAN